jgi:hypothetical protein
MPEGAPRLPPGVPGGDRRRRARDRDQFVRREADPEVRAEVRVQIDQPWRDELATGIDPLHGSVGGDAGQDGGDLTVPDPDVTLAPQPLTRVQHLAVGHDQLVLERRVRWVEAPRGRARHLGDLDRHRLRVGQAGHGCAGSSPSSSSG